MRFAILSSHLSVFTETRRWIWVTALANEAILREVSEAVRALQAVSELLDPDIPASGDAVIDAMTALEAARSAQSHVMYVVLLLTDTTVRLGASFRSIGFNFDDPYE
jgi:hypothetical protein